MFRVILPAWIGLWVLTVTSAQAQSPIPSAAPTATSSTSPKSSPSPTPTMEELINSLNSADLQAAITLLKNNFTNPDAINETQLNRAMLEGLMVRLRHGSVPFPGKEITPR